MTHTLRTLVMAGLISGALAANSKTIFDDFNDGNDTQPAWTFFDLSGGLGSRGFGPDSMHYVVSGPVTASLRGDFAMTDGEVRCEMSGWNPSVPSNSSVGILARFDPNTVSGYFLSIDADGSPNLNLVRIAGGQVAGGMTGSTKSYSPGTTYILQLIVVGANLTARIYQKGTPNTLMDSVTWTDPSPLTSGLTGVLVSNDNPGSSADIATATFDNFYATDGVVTQPTLGTPARVGSDIQFLFGGEPGRSYAVEYKEDLNIKVWSPLTSFGPLSYSASRNVTDPFTGGNRYYRVVVVDNSL